MENKVTFVVYTPSLDYAPKRMKEYMSQQVLEGVNIIVCTPKDFAEKLAFHTSDTFHLVEIAPSNNDFSQAEMSEYYEGLKYLAPMIEKRKTHNLDTTQEDTTP